MMFFIQIENLSYTKKISDLVFTHFPNAQIQSNEENNTDQHFSLTDKIYVFVDKNNINIISTNKIFNQIKRKNIFLIMVAENGDNAIECLQKGFYDYLLINNLENDFKHASTRIQQQMLGDDKLNSKNHIVIKDHKSVTKLPYNNIVFIEAYGSYSNLYTNNKFYTISKTIKSIIHNFPETFVRVHRSYAVNLDHVKSFSTDEVVMNNDTRIKISRAKKMAIIDAIQKTA
jgi:hypothetical protein